MGAAILARDMIAVCVFGFLILRSGMSLAPLFFSPTQMQRRDHHIQTRPDSNKRPTRFSFRRWIFSESISLNETRDTSLEEANQLRERARQLRAEARELELQLQDVKASSTHQQKLEADALLARLFGNRPMTGSAVARVLRDERWSGDQVVAALETLYQRQRRALAVRTAIQPTFSIGDVTNNAEFNETEAAFIQTCVACLMEASSILDGESSDPTQLQNHRWSGRVVSTLRSRLSELRRDDEKALQRRMQVEGIAASKDINQNFSIDEFSRGTLGLPVDAKDDPRTFNISRVMERVSMIPIWVPSALLPYMAATRAMVQSDDVKAIKDRVLAKSKFFCTSSESIPAAALFRGNIRMDATMDAKNATAVIFEDILRRMDAEGLSKRVQLFFLPDPEWRPGKDERELQPRPVLLALSRLIEPDDGMMQQGLFKTLLKRASFPLTIVASLLFSLERFALNPAFFNAVVNLRDAAPTGLCLPLMLGVLGVQVVHELAHVITARRHGIKVGFPIPIPSLSTGLYGCITPLRSFPRCRSALLDFALSGPSVALVLSVVLMGMGAEHTIRASESTLMNFPFVPVAVLKSSFLAGSILTVLAPKFMLLPLSQPVPISPLFVVGLSGATASALNLLPLFRLDGGRACAAAMGSRFAAVASIATLMFVLSSSLNSSTDVGFYWCVLVVLLQRKPEIPVRDDVTEVSSHRLGAWVASLVGAILTLAPFPGGEGGLL